MRRAQVSPEGKSWLLGSGLSFTAALARGQQCGQAPACCRWILQPGSAAVPRVRTGTPAPNREGRYDACSERGLMVDASPGGAMPGQREPRTHEENVGRGLLLLATAPGQPHAAKQTSGTCTCSAPWGSSGLAE